MSSYPTPDTTMNEVRTEQALIDGTVIAGAAYGVHLTLFFQCFAILVQRKPYGKNNWSMLAYICVLFTLGTVGFGGQLKFNEMMFVQYRDFPGGPLGFNFEMYNNGVGNMATASFIILNWLVDGLIIHRLYMIWGGNWFVVIFPVLMLAGSFTVSVILLVQLTPVGANLWTSSAINFGISYWSISVSINIVVTTLIVGRLLYLRSRTLLVLNKEQARTYTSIAAMLVESAALYSVTGLIFIISYALDSMVQHVMLQVLAHVQAVSPLLIILRVAQGRAWSKETVKTVTYTAGGPARSGSEVFQHPKTPFSNMSQKSGLSNATESTLVRV